MALVEFVLGEAGKGLTGAVFYAEVLVLAAEGGAGGKGVAAGGLRFADEGAVPWVVFEAANVVIAGEGGPGWRGRGWRDA